MKLEYMSCESTAGFIWTIFFLLMKFSLLLVAFSLSLPTRPLETVVEEIVKELPHVKSAVYQRINPVKSMPNLVEPSTKSVVVTPDIPKKSKSFKDKLVRMFTTKQPTIKQETIHFDLVPEDSQFTSREISNSASKVEAWIKKEAAVEKGISYQISDITARNWGDSITKGNQLK
jgi:hypothetical protein